MAELSVELFAVTVVDLSGVAQVAVTSSRDQAISHFMQQAYLFAHAAPEESFRVVGDDTDAALTGLHLIWDAEGGPIEVASLTMPGTIGSNVGWTAPDYSKQSYVQVGGAINQALLQAKGGLKASEVERLRFSRAAVALGRSLADLIANPDNDADPGPKVSQATGKRTWAEMEAVDQYVEFSAVVLGG